VKLQKAHENRCLWGSFHAFSRDREICRKWFCQAICIYQSHLEFAEIYPYPLRNALGATDALILTVAEKTFVHSSLSEKRLLFKDVQKRLFSIPHCRRKDFCPKFVAKSQKRLLSLYGFISAPSLSYAPMQCVSRHFPKGIISSWQKTTLPVVSEDRRRKSLPVVSEQLLQKTEGEKASSL